MNTMTPEQLRERLFAPFADADIEWRVSATSKDKSSGLAVPYLTNRAIQTRLDETVGIDGWRNEFKPWPNDPASKRNAQLCSISIYFPTRNEWITKSDGAENSDIEAVKGGLSDSMKRAAVQWGIGRYLYGMTKIWVNLNDRGFIEPAEEGKLNKAHGEWVRAKFGQTSPRAEQPPMPQAPPTQTQQPKPAPAQQATPNQTQQKPAAQPQTPPAQAPQTPPPQRQEPPAAPAYYQVTGAVPKPSTAGGQNTSLQLLDPDGKTAIHAFMKGVDPEVVQGAWLYGVKLTEKTQGGVRYYTLDAYEVYRQQSAA